MNVPNDWLGRLQGGVSPALVLALLLLLNPLSEVWQYATRSAGIDYLLFWSVPHVLKTMDIANIYARDGEREIASVLIGESSLPQVSQAQRKATEIDMRLDESRVAITMSPLIFALVGMTAGGAYDKDLRRFTIASWLCFLGATVIFCRLLQFSLVATLLAVALFTSSFKPLLADLQAANINQFQLLSVACFLLFTTRSFDALAGLALGFGVMLKPNLVVVAILSVFVSLVDRNYRTLTRLLLGMCIAAPLSVAISVSYFGRPSMWLDFVKSLPQHLTSSSPMESGNLGLAVLLFRTMHREVAIYIFVILMAIVSIVFFKTRSDHGSSAAPSRGADESARSIHRMFAVVGLGCAVMLMSSRLAWVHYYVLLIPLELYLIRPLARGDRPRQRLVVSVFAAIGFCLLSSAMWQVFTNAVQASIAFNAATAVMFTLALYETWWPASSTRLEMSNPVEPVSVV